VCLFVDKRALHRFYIKTSFFNIDWFYKLIN